MVYTVNCRGCKRPNHIKVGKNEKNEKNVGLPVSCSSCQQLLGSFQQCQIEGHHSDVTFCKAGRYDDVTKNKAKCTDCFAELKKEDKRNQNRLKRARKADSKQKDENEKIRRQGRTLDQQITEYIVNEYDPNTPEILAMFDPVYDVEKGIGHANLNGKLLKVQYSVHYVEDRWHSDVDDDSDDEGNKHDVDVVYDLDVYFPLLIEVETNQMLIDKYYNIEDKYIHSTYLYDCVYSYGIQSAEIVPNTGQDLRLIYANDYGEP